MADVKHEIRAATKMAVRLYCPIMTLYATTSRPKSSFQNVFVNQEHNFLYSCAEADDLENSSLIYFALLFPANVGKSAAELQQAQSTTRNFGELSFLALCILPPSLLDTNVLPRSPFSL